MLRQTLRKVASILAILKQNVFKQSVMCSVPSTVAAAAIKFFDMRNSFLDAVKPEDMIFTAFASTVSLLLVFRAIRALDIYKEGARGVHQMAGSWYDSASTLISFCRASTAPPEAVDDFKNTIVRLFSLLNMLCLVQLEDADPSHESHASGFETIDIKGLDLNTLTYIKNSAGKAEVVCQAIQCLIVDNIREGVLNLPAPILTRSFQDLGNGMLKFHDTRRLSKSPIPVTLPLVTELLLLLNVIVSPLMMPMLTKGPVIAAVATFMNNFVFFVLNGLAGEIENPFSGDFNDVDVRALHADLNVRLMELVELSTASAARTASDRSSCGVHFEPRTPGSEMHDDGTYSKKSKKTERIDDVLSDIITSSQPLGSIGQRSCPVSLASSNLQSGAPSSMSAPHQNNMSSDATRLSLGSQGTAGCSVVSSSVFSCLPSQPYNHEYGAFALREEACAVPSGESPITPPTATRTPTPGPLGRSSESPTADERIRSTSQTRPRNQALWI